MKRNATNQRRKRQSSNPIPDSRKNETHTGQRAKRTRNYTRKNSRGLFQVQQR
jgi:hypothetical protein